MAKLKKYDLSGKQTGEAEISDLFVEAEVNGQLIKDYIVAIRANARQWSASTRDRSEVSCSGKKPHAQKGSGRARQGSLASPQYRGGGIVFGPRPKFDQHVRINRKERRKAIAVLFGDKIRDGHLHVLGESEMKEPKTKRVRSFLDSLQLDKRVLFLLGSEEDSQNLRRSVANLPKVEINLALNASGYDLMVARDIIVTESGLAELNRNQAKS